MLRFQRYVSDELTHFVGKSMTDDLEGRYVLLLKIMKEGWLTHPPHDRTTSGGLTVRLNRKMSQNEMYMPQVVCFCDIPADDLGLHAEKYGRFGLSFKKSFLVGKGANPVFYIAHNSVVNVLDLGAMGLHPKELSATDPLKHLWKKTRRADLFDEMVLAFHEVSQLRAKSELLQRSDWHEKGWWVDHFLSFQVFSFLKPFNETKADQDPDNFYMEREWRVLGNVQFSLEDVSRVILPEEFAKRFRADVPEYYKQLAFL